MKTSVSESGRGRWLRTPRWLFKSGLAAALRTFFRCLRPPASTRPEAQRSAPISNFDEYYVRIFVAFPSLHFGSQRYIQSSRKYSSVIDDSIPYPHLRTNTTHRFSPSRTMDAFDDIIRAASLKPLVVGAGKK